MLQAKPNFFAKIIPYIELMRLHKPVGIYLLLWPTLTALWLASDGFPDSKLLVIFSLGVILTRSAGCVVNDIFDMKFDGSVNRTKNRPLIIGTVSKKSAFFLFVFLLLSAFILVLQTNFLTVLFSLIAVLLMSLYPLMKRITNAPQLMLGFAFSLGAPMAFFANNINDLSSIWLMIYIVLWAVIYDTIYAMVDKKEDLKIGVKSTAILFSPYEQRWILGLQILMVSILLIVGLEFNLSKIYFFAVFCTIPLMAYHQKLIKNSDKELCFKAFLNNHWIGLIIFIGVAASLNS